MIICSRCKTENNESSKFCCQCGNDLTVNVDEPASEDLKRLADTLNEQAINTEKQPFNLNKAISGIPKKIFGLVKKSVFFRKKKNTIITFSSVLLIALLVIGVLNSGYIAFTVAYNMGKYDVAKSIQGWSFNSNDVKSDIEKFVISKAESYYDDFSHEKITYEEAKEKFNITKEFTDNKDAKNKADRLKTSRISYEKAEGYEKDGDTYNAVLEYQKVIKEDKNYNTAKEKIENIKPVIKQQAIADMDACMAANDFDKGLKIVTNMEKIFSDDGDINRYKNDFEERKEAHRIQELKDNQKVKIIDAYAYNDGYYSIFRKACIVWQNNSNKGIKDVDFVILQYDNNGYPVDAEYDMYKYNGIENSYSCSADSANVVPGGTYGQGTYWNIADKATVIKACVRKVKFVDGTTWDNPYFEYWLESEK